MVTDKQFWIGLIGTIVLSTIIAVGIHAFERMADYWPLSAITIFIFTVLSIAAFYGGKLAAQSTNKHLFTSVIMGFTMIKMIFSGIIVLSYNALAEPAEKFFVLPFFILYIIFTAFEMVVMIKQARTTSPTIKKEHE